MSDNAIQDEPMTSPRAAPPLQDSSQLDRLNSAGETVGMTVGAGISGATSLDALVGVGANVSTSTTDDGPATSKSSQASSTPLTLGDGTSASASVAKVDSAATPDGSARPSRVASVWRGRVLPSNKRGKTKTGGQPKKANATTTQTNTNPPQVNATPPPAATAPETTPPTPDSPEAAASTPSYTEIRAEYVKRKPPPNISRPTDEALDKCMAALQAGDLAEHQRLVLSHCPTPASGPLPSMWIPAKEVASIFSLASIIQSLGSDDNSSETWRALSDQLCHFSLIKGKGIRFECLDESTCLKLSGQRLNICGYEVKIAQYSRYRSLFRFELVRLPNHVTDSQIYSLLRAMNLPVLAIMPSVQVGRIASRNRVVYLNCKTLPDPLRDSENHAIREISFSIDDDDEPPAIIVYEQKRYNNKTPASIAEREAKPQQTAPPQTTSNKAAEAPSRPEQKQTMDIGPLKVELTDILPEYDGVQPTPTFPTIEPLQSDLPHVWYTKIRQACIPNAQSHSAGNIVKHKIEAKDDSTDGLSTWLLPLYNKFEVLSYSDNLAIPDVDLHFQVASTDPYPVCDRLPFSNWNKTLQTYLEMDYRVENMTVAEVAAYCEDFLNHSTAVNHPVDTVLSITAQPAFHRHRLLRPNAESFDQLIIPHAYMRLLTHRVAKETKSFDDYNAELMATLRDSLPHDDAPTMQQMLEFLISRCMPKKDTNLVTLLHYAILDLTLMITSSAIYFDPLKVAAMVSRSDLTWILNAEAFMWSDQVLQDLADSKLGHTLLTSHLPTGIMNSIRFAREHLPCYA